MSLFEEGHGSCSTKKSMMIPSPLPAPFPGISATILQSQKWFTDMAGAASGGPKFQNVSQMTKNATCQPFWVQVRALL